MNQDPTKICFCVDGIDGNYIRQQLKDVYLIDPENANSQMLLLSFHIGTSPDIVDELIDAIVAIKNSTYEIMQTFSYKSDLVKSLQLPLPEYKYSINEVFQKKWV
jgi:hypothetical protein